MPVQSADVPGGSAVFMSSMPEVSRRARSTGFVHSLSYVSMRFERVFESLGYWTQPVADPAIYTTSLGLESSARQDRVGSLHVAIREWSDLRLMPAAAMNIAHFSWEGSSFPESLDRGFGSGPLPTLAAFDRVWAISGFVESALREHGIENVDTVPVPIASASEISGTVHEVGFSRLLGEIARAGNSVFSPYFHHDPTFTDSADWGKVHARLDSQPVRRLLRLLRAKWRSREDGPRIFVTQGNPGDKRKNLLRVMEGFGLHAADQPESVLIVLAPPQPIDELSRSLNDAVGEAFGWGWWGCRNVFIVPMHLSDDAQHVLYALSDYFLNASLAEGQHIPLQEAVQAGCLPISPIHTAVAEYLSPDWAVTIPSRAERVLIKEDRSGLEFVRIHHVVDPLDIAEACESAVGIARDVRLSHVKNLQEDLVPYTFDDVGNKVSSLLRARS